VPLDELVSGHSMPPGVELGEVLRAGELAGVPERMVADEVLREEIRLGVSWQVVPSCTSVGEVGVPTGAGRWDLDGAEDGVSGPAAGFGG
jgi:hypothetical protein